MTPIPPKIRKLIDADPFYRTCALFGQNGHVCGGRVTMDHAIEFANKQVQELWAIVPICARGHGVDDYQGHPGASKELRTWVAVNRATIEELYAVSKAMSYVHEKNRLNQKYGVYKQVVPSFSESLGAFKDTNSKKNWYLITDKDSTMIEKMRQFNSKALNINLGPRQVIEMAIENLYREIAAGLESTDPKMYKELAFDK